MTVHNAAQWLEEALDSVHSQTFTGSLELSVFDDASTVSASLYCDQLGHFLVII